MTQPSPSPPSPALPVVSPVVMQVILPVVLPALRPRWLRPAALLMILGLHAALFRVPPRPPSLLTPLNTVEIALVPAGDAPEDQKEIAEIAPRDPPTEETQVDDAPPQETPPPAPPPVIAPDAVPLPAPPVEKAREKKMPQPPVTRAQQAPERSNPPQQGRNAAHRGVANGAPAAGGLSQASYAALVAAEIRRRTYYPAAARANGVSGDVGVAFTIGASGRVARQSIVRSSGDAALDGAARAILASLHLPPPPGGGFSASTSIRFHLN
jgi:periplasmic protein TonB